MLVIPVILNGQTHTPVVQGSTIYQFKNGVKIDSALFAPRRDTTNADPTMIAPGMFQWRPQDQSFYGRDSVGWKKFAFGANVIDQIDTVPTIATLQSYIGTAKIVLVTDSVRGGFFYRKAAGATNSITIFSSTLGAYWYRVYNPEDGILVDWAGADPTGVSNSAPAFQAAFAFSNHIVCRANATYLITDSLNIINKRNFVLDGKNATIKESTSFYTTLLVKKGIKITIKDLNFDGPENYAYFLTNDPASPKQHIYVDSTDWFTGYHLFSQNKRGMITLSNCSYYSLDDLSQDGIFKNGVASNVLGTFGIRIIGYGFNEPINYWTGKATINKFIAKNTGAAILVGDNATYLTISNCTFDSTYNNGIYISSGLWCSVIGNVMRNVGGTGIKARGFGYTITGNIITNADLGIVVTGNSAESFYGVIPTKYNTNGYSETVANNVIDTVSTRGIDVDFQDGLATHNTTITGNTVRINTSATDYILKVNTAGGTIISNNRFQGSLSTIGCYFQRATGDSTQTNIISNNIFRDFAGQGIHFQGLKRSIVSGNNFDSIGAAALVFDNSTGNRISDNTYKAGSVLNITSANGNSDNFISGNIGASITADNLTSILSLNYPNNQQNITGTPRIVGQVAVSGTDPYISNGTTSSANWIRLTPASRTLTIAGTAPISSSAGAQDLTANRTWTISMTQANTSTNGWLSSTDWNTFNGKAPATGGTGYIQNQFASAQTADFWITGNGRINNTFRIATSNVSAAPFHVGTLPSYANLSAVFEGNVQTIPAAANNQAVTLQQLKDTVYKRLPGKMVPTVSQLANYGAGDSLILVTDTLRGGLFTWSTSGTADNGMVFAGSSGYWNRQSPGDYVDAAWWGAVGNGSSTNQHTPINNAINYAVSNGVTRVKVRYGHYLLGGSIRLKSNIWLDVDKNAWMELTPGSNAYMVTNDDLVNGNTNIQISGGRWAGNGYQQTISDAGSIPTYFLGFGFHFYLVKQLNVHDLRVDSTQAWAIAHIGCRFVTFRNIRFIQYMRAGGWNGDGVSGSSSDVLIENISGYTNDDMVGVNATYVGFGAIGFPGPYYPVFSVRNVTVRNVSPEIIDSAYVARDSAYSWRAVRVFAASTTMSNVTIENIKGITFANPVHIDSYNPGELPAAGKFSNITVRDVKTLTKGTAQAAFGYIGIAGVNHLDNILIEDIGVLNTDKPYYPMVKIARSNGSNIILNNIQSVQQGVISPMVVDSLSNIQNIQINNSYHADSLFTVSNPIYKRFVLSGNTFTTHLQTSNVRVVDASSVIQRVNSARVALTGTDFKIDTSILTGTDGDIVRDQNAGISLYSNGRWNAHIQNQQSSAQPGMFWVAGQSAVGSGAPADQLTVTTPNNAGGIGMVATSTISASSGPFLRFYQTGIPTASGQRLGGLLAGALVSGNRRTGAQIDFLADGAWTDNVSHPTAIRFLSAPSGSPSVSEWMRISSAGYLGIGTTSPSVPLDVTGNGRFTGAVDANDINIFGNTTTRALKTQTRTITSSTSVTNGDYTIISTAVSGNPTITLPSAASSSGRILVLVDEAPNTTTNGMNWTPAVKYKNSTATSFIGGPLLSAYTRITIQSDGTNWVVISGM